MSGRFLTQPAGKRITGRRPWYKRRHYQLLICVAVVAAAVLTDRYDNYTPTEKQHQLASLYQTVRQDLAFCEDGVADTSGRWKRLEADPDKSAARSVASLAGQAEANCTPVSTDGGVYNLASLQVPGSLSGVGSLSVAVYDLTEWAYPDAARALLDIESLARHPGDAASAQQLQQMTEAMATEARNASGIFNAAAGSLGSKLAPLGLASP